jgi:hypothetical protein
VRAILYSAPSRLIGHRLKVRLYSDRLDCYLSGALVLTLARGARSPINGRGRVIDYRHFIDALKRKPQAFKALVFRDALFPREATGAPEQLRKTNAAPSLPDHGWVLELAAKDGKACLRRLEALVGGELLREARIRPRRPCTTGRIQIPAASSYDGCWRGCRMNARP